MRLSKAQSVTLIAQHLPTCSNSERLPPVPHQIRLWFWRYADHIRHSRMMAANCSKQVIYAHTEIIAKLGEGLMCCGNLVEAIGDPPSAIPRICTG